MSVIIFFFYLRPLFIFMSPGNTELWAVFKGCWWHWTWWSTRLIPSLLVLCETPALSSDRNQREAQAEQVTQKLELAQLFHSNSVVSDYYMIVISPWDIKKELYIHCISYYLCLMFWSEIIQSGWPPWHATGATPGNGFLKKVTFPDDEELGVGRGNLWVNDWLRLWVDWLYWHRWLSCLIVLDSCGGNCCLQVLEKKM